MVSRADENPVYKHLVNSDLCTARIETVNSHPIACTVSLSETHSLVHTIRV